MKVKIGQKVKIISKKNGEPYKNLIGTITSIENSGVYVKFSEEGKNKIKAWNKHQRELCSHYSYVIDPYINNWNFAAVNNLMDIV